MSTATDTPAAPARQTAEEFGERIFGVFNDAAITLLLSIGHRTGLFDLLAGMAPSTSAEVAAQAGLNERYVREWLNGMVVARVIEYDPRSAAYRLPEEHAASLTTAAGSNNVALLAQMIALLGEVESPIVECFRTGGGLGYDHYPRFHEMMAEESASWNDQGLLDVVVPTAGLHDRLSAGATLADIGCGSGHAINLLARAYPASTFVGYDFSEEAIAAGTAEASGLGLSNARFEVADVATLGVEAEWDIATAFDAIHDQAHPAAVLDRIFAGLKPGGTFVMIDINADSNVEANTSLPWASFLYTVSLMHCMTVSLSEEGGTGLGTVWGKQVALQMLSDAGFVGSQIFEVETDPFNAYYVSTKPG